MAGGWSNVRVAYVRAARVLSRNERIGLRFVIVVSLLGPGGGLGLIVFGHGALKPVGIGVLLISSLTNLVATPVLGARIREGEKRNAAS